MPETDGVDKILELFEDEVGSLSKSDRTRLRIMASAAEVFNDKGFSEASIQDIADNAGIAKGTIYYYVDKKEDLLLMLINFGQARLFNKVDKALAKATTASEKIDALIRNHLNVMKVIGPIIPFFVQSIVASNSKVRQQMADLRRQYLQVLTGIIEEGVASGEFRTVDANKTAIAIVGMVVGQMMQHKVFEGKINIKAIADTTLDIVLNSLRTVQHED